MFVNLPLICLSFDLKDFLELAPYLTFFFSFGIQRFCQIDSTFMLHLLNKFQCKQKKKKNFNGIFSHKETCKTKEQ